jgi:hypothetical protein
MVSAWRCSRFLVDLRWALQLRSCTLLVHAADQTSRVSEVSHRKAVTESHLITQSGIKAIRSACDQHPEQLAEESGTVHDEGKSVAPHRTHLEALWVLEAVAQSSVGVIAVHQLRAAAAHLDHHIALDTRAARARYDRGARFHALYLG